jgi:protein-L-isoaspartate(D-aspartate) O-methyltransferase
MFDFKAARSIMVDSQLRPNGVTSPRVLDAMEAVAREAFLPEGLRTLAYSDEDLPLAPGRVLIAPMHFARLLQIAGIKPENHVLIIGAETGYGAAVIAGLAAHVAALESDPDLVSALRINTLGLPNITIAEGPLVEGAPALAPFDVIVIMGQVAALPDPLLAQLLPEGRIVAAFGQNRASKLSVWTRQGMSAVRRDVFEANTAVLPGFSTAKPAFVFA